MSTSTSLPLYVSPEAAEILRQECSSGDNVDARRFYAILSHARLISGRGGVVTSRVIKEAIDHPPLHNLMREVPPSTLAA